VSGNVRICEQTTLTIAAFQPNVFLFVKRGSTAGVIAQFYQEKLLNHLFAYQGLAGLQDLCVVWSGGSLMQLSAGKSPVFASTHQEHIHPPFNVRCKVCIHSSHRAARKPTAGLGGEE